MIWLPPLLFSAFIVVAVLWWQLRESRNETRELRLAASVFDNSPLAGLVGDEDGQRAVVENTRREAQLARFVAAFTQLPPQHGDHDEGGEQQRRQPDHVVSPAAAL